MQARGGAPTLSSASVRAAGVSTIRLMLGIAFVVGSVARGLDRGPALLAAAAGARPATDGGKHGAAVAVASADEDRGCAYREKCPIARPRCAEERPPLSDHGGGRRAACFFPGEMP